MEFIVWKADYDLGLEMIDQQHRRLAQLINQLYDLLGGVGPQKKEVLRILDELISYTQYHFTAEEDLMQKHEYTGFTDHRAEHVRLTQQVIRKREEYLSMGSEFDSDLLHFLRDWLLKHTQSTDRKYLPCVKPQ